MSSANTRDWPAFGSAILGQNWATEWLAQQAACYFREHPLRRFFRRPYFPGDRNPWSNFAIDARGQICEPTITIVERKSDGTFENHLLAMSPAVRLETDSDIENCLQQLRVDPSHRGFRLNEK